MMSEQDATLRARVQARLAETPDLLAAPSRFERRVRVREAVARMLADDGLAMPPREIARLVHEIADQVVGLGPLEPLLRDPAATEIMVLPSGRVYVERDGCIEDAGIAIQDARTVMHAIERIVAPLGLRIDESMPWVDARLPDGSRVHAIIPPLSVGGPALTIRRFAVQAITAADLIERGAWTDEICEMLAACVRARANIVVSGGTGAGKTTLLNVLSSFIPAGERIVTIEDAAELRLQQPHVVALQSRPPNVEGRGMVTIRDLVRNALRMRPDRIVVGEVRGGEALDMLQAMNSGHEGSMSTVHANSSADLLARVEALVLMSASPLTVQAARRQIGAGLDLIVHVARSESGRRIVEVAEVRARGDELIVEPLARREGGTLRATGIVPRALSGVGERWS